MSLQWWIIKASSCLRIIGLIDRFKNMGFRYFNGNLVRFCKSSTRSIQSTSIHKKLLIPRLYDRSSFAYPENPSFNIPKRWHVGHSHHHHHHDQTSEEGERIFRLGLAADIGLTAGKALTGYLSGSTAIIADAAHSLSDVVISWIYNRTAFLIKSIWILLQIIRQN